MKTGCFPLSRREFVVALISAGGAIAIFAATQSHPPAVMDSAAFDWNQMTVTTNETGSVRSVFRAPTATLDELECHITTLNPGVGSHPAHQHANEEVVIIREGQAEVLVNGEAKRVGPGSVVFFASNVMHSLRNVGDTPAVYHVLSWYSPGLKPKVETNSPAK